LFIELVWTGLQTRLQTRLSEKIEFFKRPDNLSSRPNDGTFDHHFAYRITPTRTYNHNLKAFCENLTVIFCEAVGENEDEGVLHTRSNFGDIRYYVNLQ
jgi:hypothetical protein